MQTEESQTEGAASSDTSAPEVLQNSAVVDVVENRIYVWSSPAPYAVVIQESRSFHRHI